MCQPAGERAKHLKSLSKEILQCQDCVLSETRTHPVPGEGSIDAILFFVGEAPGRVNDETGRPFVGHGGKIFDTILAKCGIRRNDVFITNAVKCWPPNNRRPRMRELRVCNHYLQNQITLVQPKCIVTLGAVAYEAVTGKKIKLRDNHGHLNQSGAILVCATFHPNGIRYIKGGRETIINDIQCALRHMGIRTRKDNIQGSLFQEPHDEDAY